MKEAKPIWMIGAVEWSSYKKDFESKSYECINDEYHNLAWDFVE